MKNILLIKIGMLLFLFTLIMTYHLKDSKFYLIKSGNQGSFSKETANRLKIPVDKYLPQEDYYELVNGHYYSAPIVANTVKKTLPFHDINRIIITISLLISCSLIILAVNLGEMQNKKLLLIALPFITIFAFENAQIKITINKQAQIRKSLSNLESDFSELKNEVESQETRISDLEY